MQEIPHWVTPTIITVVLLFSIILHELAHGYSALWLGDTTAKVRGRLSFNPIRHIDLFYTILLPGMLMLAGSPVVFGGAKPVPVDPRNFKFPRRDMGIVAIAGPISNFILASIGFALFYVSRSYIQENSIWALFLSIFIGINLVLGLFNLVPIPPLDGGRIVTALLPQPFRRYYASLERYGFVILFLLLYLGYVQQALTWLLSFLPETV